MNVRDYARSIVLGDTLEAKLVALPDAREEAPRSPALASLPSRTEPREIDPEPALRIAAPGRPANLAITPGREARVPPIAGMSDPAQRARILHALANHELQAIELFAWALLAFPDAPIAFRRGLLAIVADEQRHFTLYRERLEAHDVAFGDHPVTGHFWNKLDHLADPLSFVCAMGLTFEAANLDFAGDYSIAARACGDDETARVLDRVHDDEIAHVHFAWTWLGKLAGPTDAWTAYTTNIKPPLGPHRARGARFDQDARRRAGFDDAFIAQLAAIAPKRPSGEPR